MGGGEQGEGVAIGVRLLVDGWWVVSCTCAGARVVESGC